MGEHSLAIQHDEHPQGLVMSVIGEVDVYSVPVLTRGAVAALDRLAGAGGRASTDAPCLVVDLASVPFMDSAGLGALVGLLRRARQERVTVVLAAAQDPVARLLRLTGLSTAVLICEDVAAALHQCCAGTTSEL